MQTSRTTRYTAVALAGLALDAALVMGGLWVGFDLWAATLAGYTAALIATYLAHEKWTMAGNNPAAGRFALYVAICAAVGVGRAGTAHGLAMAGAPELVAWVLSVGASFVANGVLVLTLLGKKTGN